MVDLDDFGRAVKVGVERVMSGLPPEGDIMPFLHIRGAEEVVVELPGGWLAHGEPGKDALAALITGILGKSGAEAVAYISAGWMLLAGEGLSSEQLAEMTARGTARPSQNPHRVEVVNICLMDRERFKLLTGRVRRGKKAPRIIRWDEEFAGEGAELGGRFPEALREGLEAAAR